MHFVGVSAQGLALPCIRLARMARGKFELTNQDSAGGKNVSWQERHWNQATFLIGDCIKYSLKGDLQFPKPFHIAKSEKYETL